MSNQITKISENTLRSLAEGLFQYHEKIAGQPHQYLSQYPPLLQLSINNLNLVGLLNGGPIIKGIPEFVSDWARKPLEDWGLPMSDNQWEKEYLVEKDGQISSFCLEIKSNPNATGNFQKEIIKKLMAKCQKNKQLYTDCRKFLIEFPTVTKNQLTEKSLGIFSPIKEILENCYESAPLSYQLEGIFYKCSYCQGLMYLNKENNLLCENKRCQHNAYKADPITKLQETEELLWLKKDLRYFIHYPGLAELDLEKKLSKMDLRINLYPDLDKYDLQIIFPDQRIWAVDVKCWQLARELARNLINDCQENEKTEPIPQILDSPHEKSFFVFPDEITSSQNEYKNEFFSIVSGRLSLERSQILFISEFLEVVQYQLQLIKSGKL